jgi:hypothetical protein
MERKEDPVCYMNYFRSAGKVQEVAKILDCCGMEISTGVEHLMGRL